MNTNNTLKSLKVNSTGVLASVGLATFGLIGLASAQTADGAGLVGQAQTATTDVLASVPAAVAVIGGAIFLILGAMLGIKYGRRLFQ